MQIGPTTFFGNERVFVDREACIQAFRENIQNSGNKEYNVLFYHGIAGIGKSKLQKELQRLLDKEFPEILWAAIDLNTKTYREVGTFLITLRNKIQEKSKAKFYLFNIAHAIYWKKLHPEIPLLIENYPLVKEGKFFTKIIDVLNEFGPSRLIWDTINNAPDNVRRIFKEQAIDINVLTAMEAHEIERFLPRFFAADFTDYLGAESKAYIFIDTYEALWEGLRNKGSFHEKDEWIRVNLIQNMPGVSWVICGREKLLWNSEYNFDCKMDLEQHSVDELPKRYCTRFLVSCGVRSKNIRDVIIKASEGVPYYLNLSADTFEKINKKRQPVPEDFGKTQLEIFNTFVKYLEDNEIKALEVLSVPNSWDRYLFKKLMTEFDTGYHASKYSELIKFSFIKTSFEGKYSIHQLMRKSLLEHQAKDDKKSVHEFMFDYYNNKLEGLDIKAITPEHEISLTEAFYHSKEALDAEELCEWFISVSNPFDRAAFWQLITLMYEEMLQILEAELGPQHPDVAVSLNNIALLYYSMGDYGKALPLYQRALDIREKALGPQHPNVAESLNNLAELYKSMGDYGKALPLYQRALQISEKALGPQHPNVAASLNNTALLYDSMGDYGKALPLYQRALEIHEKALGPEHPKVAANLNNLAGLYDSMGDYGKALSLYQRALDIREKTLGPQHPDVAVSLNNTALLYYNMGDYGKALPLNQRALQISEKALGSEHPDVATCLNNIALLYDGMRDYGKALPLYQRALQISEKALGSEHPDVATCLNNLGGLYYSMGDYGKALPLYQRALDVREKALGPEHPKVVASLNNLAGLYKSMRDYGKALPLYQRALQISIKNGNRKSKNRN